MISEMLEYCDENMLRIVINAGKRMFRECFCTGKWTPVIRSDKKMFMWLINHDSEPVFLMLLRRIFEDFGYDSDPWDLRRGAEREALTTIPA